MKPRTAIIGAGSSGIAALKALRDADLPTVCFEASDEVGGNWYFRNPNNRSAAYESLHINTDSELMAYSDYPMPEGTPDYPGHKPIHRYFRSYVEHFGLRDAIRFNTEVTRARRLADGRWRLDLAGGDSEEFDALLVANGHHWDPRWPEPYPGEFSGTQLHSHDYINPGEPVDMRGQRIMVVGMGNSAMDIACELCNPAIAEKLFLSHRRGVWILPKYLFGIPVTKLCTAPAWMPWRLGAALVSVLVRLSVGTPQQYGLKKPDHGWLQNHPTVSQDIFVRLGSGDILPRPGIRRFDGQEVEFTDGTRERVDIVIWCTGYKVSFPFFDADFLDTADNDLPLWMRMMRPDIDNLFFVGLCQPLGAIMPIAEAQGRFIAAVLSGRLTLPDRARMEREMAQER
ncbi:MAG: NAD(P)-binding domain-containing protein, partial [Xanthomonadales bacterium]|nr:NAD(P)-binding domain-containing protein [Xanthomonadales bacterium]